MSKGIENGIERLNYWRQVQCRRQRGSVSISQLRRQQTDNQDTQLKSKFLPCFPQNMKVTEGTNWLLYFSFQMSILALQSN